MFPELPCELSVLPWVQWIISQWIGHWSWKFDLTVINISFAGSTNATACFFHGPALIRSSFLVCFGFGKAQIFFGIFQGPMLMYRMSAQNVLTPRCSICMCSCLLVLISRLYIQGSFPLLPGDRRDWGTVPLQTACWKKRSAEDKGSTKGFQVFF